MISDLPDDLSGGDIAGAHTAASAASHAAYTSPKLRIGSSA
jgi:hypothetical protein